MTKEEIRSKIFEKIGYATMCWTPKPSGVFDSTECAKTGDEIMELVEQYSQVKNNEFKDKLDAAMIALNEIKKGTPFPLSVAQNALQILKKNKLCQ